MNGSDRTYQASPLQRIHMPKGYGISLAAYTGRGTPHEARIPKDFGLEQSLRGFEETYRNIIDYIVRITFRIWEDRDVGYIRDCYAPNSRVFDDYGLQLGSEKIVSDTLHTTGAFSDIKLIADEVIWAGDDDVGFHTSHRTIIRGTNDGDSHYGPATGKQVDVLVIANCVALGNDIFLEHVLYNSSSMLEQLGFDIGQHAAQLAANPMAGWPRDRDAWKSLREETSPAQPISVSHPVEGFDPDRLVRAALDRIWNQRDFAALANIYDTGFRFEGPTNRSFSGTTAYGAFLTTILAAFPDLVLRVDEVYWMGNDVEGYLVATRWSAEATHDGAGPYGEPTGRRVQVWGITQQKIINGTVTREWMLFNEFDLMIQVAQDK